MPPLCFGGRGALRVLVLIALCGLCCARPAHAGTEISHDSGLALSPYSETGDRLKIKTVDVQADVRNGLARTTLTTVFSNTIPQPCQASLDLTVPHDTVVTGYAYWFKGERIQAHLLDNDKAWEIYSTITSHHRDPAIMEQWYDTTYHLQIYPVEPAKDLRVEVTYVAPLESDEHGLYYRLPIAAGPNAATLARFTGRVTVHGVETSRLEDTEGSSARSDAQGAVYSLERADWKPERDWLFRLKPRYPHSESFGQAAATGPGRGFFSVVLWSDRALDRPQFRVFSGAARDVHQRGFAREVPAGRRLLVEGRYLRAGQLRVAFRDRRSGWSQAVLTLPARGGSVIPKKLWAASEIKRQSGALGHWEQHKNLAAAERRKVVRMSLDYGVMSPYTAWLAVPKAEFEFYKKVKSEQRVQTNVQTARGGDPLIRVTAGPDVVRVTALLPTGEPVPMQEMRQGEWEGRFDMPAETAEGEYRVVVLVQKADGSVHRLTLTYHIDRQGPVGQGQVRREGDTARFSVEADADTKVAYVLLPDGRKLFLTRSGESGPFTGQCLASELGDGKARVVLIDGAHNVTTLDLDPR